MLRDYLLSPEKFWPETHCRNSLKLQKNLIKGCGSNDKKIIEKYVDNIISLAELRSRFSPKHVYIVNAGSSGSHWLEKMLSFFPNFHNGGEIYIPKNLINYMGKISGDQANIILDAIYIVHTGDVFKDSLSATISNSAHLAKHNRISKFSRNKLRVLLLRNPVDIVASRTFRKDEYKKYVAPNASDKEYLERNCSYVENFFKEIVYDDFDIILKYEDILSDPKNIISKILSYIDVSACDADLEKVVALTSKEAIKKSVEEGRDAVTNVYLGERKDYGWAMEYIEKRVHDVALSMGYL
ncbi:hypothetical protein EKK97_12795 [Billgrantia tianxiuensis]|uniref:Sulfotransferase domain-containing protein n=1 Tax=Billgrantia tianxiuensis TaxID=2497861 RepID=A0A6I6SRZ1_9GAMM|nr:MULTISPECIES: sulfotransferase domain-containing protein [Halomonas]MCE8031556.1 hypothetical protein [Halomonas sp. MCCC 1A11057]QHC50285.1 hypothetical protein EKK97_12795 [Halomonas tianxiuensis]